jgi:hypothetical protein
MKFMAIMWSGVGAAGGTQADFDAWAEFEQEARDAGVYVDGGAFEPPSAARLVRTTISGHELPEASVAGTLTTGDVQPAAYYLFECDDLDEAVGWANRLPTYGQVEVRQLMQYDEFES